MKYILASASPRRKELMALTGLQFDVFPAQVDEVLPKGLSPARCAKLLAAQKAEFVARLFPKDCIIGADTIVVINDEILGKPKDDDSALRMLRLLSGREHHVITGVCLMLGEDVRVFSRETRVWFYPLREDEIGAYVRSGEPMDKAGAYGIQGQGALLVERIEGDYFNVVGLPVAKLMRELRAFTCLRRD